jgi:hypothetical protein
VEWDQFMREERARKLAHLRVLMSGNVTILARSENRTEDVSSEIIRETLVLIEQIETILRRHRLPLEDQPVE